MLRLPVRYAPTNYVPFQGTKSHPAPSWSPGWCADSVCSRWGEDYAAGGWHRDWCGRSNSKSQWSV